MIGPRGEGSEEIVPPSKDDMRAVIDAAGEDLRLMLIFAASTGARAGEQWAARWQDVDFDKCELRIAVGWTPTARKARPRARPACGPSLVLPTRRDAEGMEAKVAVLKVGRPDVPEPGRRTHRARQPDQAAIPAAVRLAPNGQTLQLAWPPTLCGIMLDRSRACAQDGTDLRRPRIAASHDGPIRPPLPERRSPEGDGPHRQGTIRNTYAAMKLEATNRGGLGRELTRTYFTTKSSTVPTRSWGQVTEQPKRLANKRSCHVPTV